MAGLTHDLDKYPMLNSLNADPRYLGCAASLVPMIQFTSSQRLNMASTNLIQALPIKGCEMPNVASGYERQFLDYTFNPTRMPQSGTSLYVIPKYRANAGSNPIKSTPSYTLIYLGEEDNKIHCIEVPTYMKGVDGFGYPTEINPRMLRPGIGLTKDDTIVHSHSVDGSKYMLGTNANVCYITMKETVEDAFCISDRFADKLESTGIKTVIVDIDKNDVPLNLYGDVDNYKFCPDIGEYVREDGLIIALRSVNDNSIISDMNETALTIPQYQHDNTIYAAAPNAVIIDIDVWVNENRKVKTPEYIFSQCNKYVEGNKQYYKRIIDIYNSECVEKKYEPSVEFGTLVERAVMHLSAYNRGMTFGGMSKKTPPKFSRKNEPISFIQMAITYMFKYKVSEGFKVTNRYGGKGTLSKIYRECDMPVDDFGNIADICISPESTLNRMNLGQLYEQFLNICITKIIKEIKETKDYVNGYWRVLEFFNDVNPSYANVVSNVCCDDTKRYNLIKEAVEKEQLIVVVPSFLDTLSPEWCLKMADKYKIESSPVSYNLRDGDGNLIRRVRTKKNIFIGKKYMYVLCKIPYPRACSVSYVNQYKIPIRIKEKKAKESYPVGLTPIRLGEDEVRNLVMMIGEETTAKILALYANAPEETNKLVKTLMTADDPTNIPSVFSDASDIVTGNQTIKVYQHLMNTVGVDSVHTTATPEEIEELSKIEENFKW